MNPAERLASALDAAEAFVIEAGAIKARDPREPGRKQKQKDEIRLAALIRRMFRAQERRVMDYARLLPKAAKAIDVPDSIFEDEETVGEIVRIYGTLVRQGITLYEAAATIGMDYTMVNANAARVSRKLALDMIDLIDKKTKKTIRDVITDYVNTPGMTLGDVASRLPYQIERAERIATTEVTRAYAAGEQEAANEAKRQLPDVKVVKIWFTNNDDIVCEICGPLEGTEVEHDEDFLPGVPHPPAHPNCRCWIQSRTRIGG